MNRHFTVTAFVSTPEATLLHWHRKVGLWLPPGGHIEADEDPVQAALRETREETGLDVEILPCGQRHQYADPAQLPPPVTIMLEPIGESNEGPPHQHIDMIYFSRPRDGSAAVGEQWHWVDRNQLACNDPMVTEAGRSYISEDVRVLGIASIDRSAVEGSP